MKILEVSGKIKDIDYNKYKFSKLYDVNVKMKGSPHKFIVELGIIDEKWGLKVKNKYNKLEFEELFCFKNKCEDFESEKVIDISEATLKLDNKILGEPLQI